MRIPAYAFRQSGLSLVELMVGMLVGLIGIIIISHLYVTNEQYKRSTTGAGAAQVNGAVALYTIERDLRMAGYGINHSAALGCKCTGVECSPLRYYYNKSYSAFAGATAPAAGEEVPSRTIAPVVIKKTPDLTNSITLLYSGDSERATPNILLQTMSEPYHLNADGTAGFETGNFVVVTEGDICALTQVTVETNPALKTQQLLRPDGPYNPPLNGDLPRFGKGAYVFNLGTNPVWRTYEIANNKLRATDALPPKGGSGGQDLIDDIVDMQALYGMDDGIPGGTTANDGNIDRYVNSDFTPTTAAGWQQVLAVRIAVLARSQNYEKPTGGGVCQATTVDNQPRWGPRINATDPPPNTFPKLEKDLKGAVNDAGCYKYRVFETVVPLRNMIWRSS